MKSRKKRTLTRAERNIAWCERYLSLPDGRFVGHPLKIAKFMKEDFKIIFDNPHGTRRAIITRGRKNAKSVECAMILLLYLVGPEWKANAQLYSIAQSREQAAIVFSLAAKMVRMSPELRSVVTVRDTAKQLHCKELGTLYRALSAETSTAFGLNPTLCIVDELGQVRGPRSSLFEAMETATSAQEDPLTLIISTQAASDNDLLSILIDDAKQGHDPRTVLRMDTAPLTMDPFSVEAIKAANPAYNIFMNKREVLDMAKTARRMPSREAEYSNLVLNRRVEANNPFVTPSEWEACSFAPESIRGIPVYAGLDLSSVSDLTAFVMIGRVNSKWQVHPTFWLPSEGLREKSQSDRVPYDMWADQGYLQTTPGTTVSYEHVAHFLRGMFDQYNIQKVAFDRWNMKHLKPWLEKAGFSPNMIKDRFEEFGQGTQSMSPALRDLEASIRAREIAHGNHPVLSMCAACAVVEGKDDANRKLSKNKSSRRIDGMVALTMAMGIAAQMRPVDVRTMVA